MVYYSIVNILLTRNNNNHLLEYVFFYIETNINNIFASQFF